MKSENILDSEFSSHKRLFKTEFKRYIILTRHQSMSDILQY